VLDNSITDSILVPVLVLVLSLSFISDYHITLFTSLFAISSSL
jgi:hypothetical protein